MVELTKPLAAYSHVREVAGLVFVAGQGCRDPKTNNYCGIELDHQGGVRSYDIKVQTRGVLQNIERVLQSIGLDRKNIIDIHVFLTDMKDFEGMNAVWNEFFSLVPTTPTRTTVAVKQLPGLNFVEMKVVATRT